MFNKSQLVLFYAFLYNKKLNKEKLFNEQKKKNTTSKNLRSLFILKKKEKNLALSVTRKAIPISIAWIS